jgi:NADPH-dependent F420 reductase
MAPDDESARSRAETYAEFAALVGGLAHEIRNPLSTIRLNMELLAEDFAAEDPESPTKHRDRRARAKIELVRQECDRLQKLLGETVKVVAAFQNVSAHHLRDLTHSVDCDVLVCGDDIPARETVIGLVRDVGLRGVHAGPIANAAAAEALTSVLIAINIRYKVPGTGIRITGLPSE